MRVVIYSQGMAKAILNGLPSQFESIIITIDTSGESSELFNLDIVKSILPHKEKRETMREGSRAAALIEAYSHAGHSCS